MKCYHTTLKERIPSILEKGLLPNSEPAFFTSSVPYIMLSLAPWPELHGEKSVVLEVTYPDIKLEFFDNPEGLRWPEAIPASFLKIYTTIA